MRKFKNIIVALITLWLSIDFSFGTHIVGGELNYRHLGNFVYEIRLTVYRDCYNGIPPFDDPASIGVFDVNDSLVFNILTPRRSVSLVPLALYNPCIIPPIDVCYEVTTYIDTITLPPIPGGYQLAYQRCCRNQTILNIVNPLNTGATYYAHVPDTSMVNDDSNPVFKYWTPPFICANVPFRFDHSAIDYDGDSLVYELFHPYDGASYSIPMPQPPNNPPYPNIVWQSPYSTNDMLGGAPLQIDPQTGWLTCTPNTLGQFVIGVKCKEYRNGVLIGETLRDYQINVVACQSSITAALQVPSVICDTYTASFTNNSTGASTYYWNFGDPNSTADTSDVFQPSYTYSDTGTYQVMLIAYGNPQGCNDTSYSTVKIYPNSYNNNFTWSNTPCNATVLFSNQQDSLNGPVSSIQWDFGDGAGSSLQNPSHNYSASGYFNVLFTVNYASGCMDTVMRQVPVSAIPPTFVTADMTICQDTVILHANGGVNYLWDHGSLLSDSTVSDPFAFPVDTTTFNVLITTINNVNDTCIVNKNVTLSTSPVVNTNFSFQTVPCTGQVDFMDLSTVASGGFGGWAWNFGDNSFDTIMNPSHTYSSLPDTFMVKLQVYNSFGCYDSLIIPVPVYGPGLTTISPNTTLCKGDSTQLFASGGIQYIWTPSGGLSSDTISNPIAFPAISTVYTVQITTVTPAGDTCTQSRSVSIGVDSVRADFSYYRPSCRQDVMFYNTSYGSLTYRFWAIDTGGFYTDTVYYQFYNSGVYPVTLYVGNAFCSNSITKNVLIPSMVTATTGLNQSVCSGNSVQLSASGGSSYVWTPSGGLSNDSISSPVASPGTTTVYIVAVSDTNAAGEICTDYDTTAVIVYPKPVAGFNYSFVNCGNQVMFTDNSSIASGSISNWNWTLGDGSFSTVPSPSHSYGNGTFNPQLIVTSDQGCKDTVNSSLLVDSSPISINGDSTICRLRPVRLNVTGGDFYSWTPSSSLNQSDIANPIASPSSTTIYTCLVGTVKSNGDTCYASLSTSVNVSELIGHNYSATISKDTIIRGESVNLLLDPIIGVNAITWTPDTALNDPFIYNPVSTPDHTIEYWVSVTDIYGCAREIEKVKVVVISNLCGEPDVFIPTGFTPNGDGINDIFRLRGNNVSEMYLAVYDRWGEKLFESTQQTVGWDGTYKGKDLDPAVYAFYVKVKCRNGEEFFKKGNVTLIR